jgi:hypothetical protein
LVVKIKGCKKRQATGESSELKTHTKGREERPQSKSRLLLRKSDGGISKSRQSQSQLSTVPVLSNSRTANKPTELSDYSVCTTWGIKGKRVYLLHVFRKRLGYPELKRAVREQAGAFNPKTIMIEDKASGTGERSWDYVGTPPAFAPQAFRHFMRHLLLLDSIHLDNGLHRMGRPIESANDPCGRFWHALRNWASGSKQNAMSAVADGFYLSQGA